MSKKRRDNNETIKHLREPMRWQFMGNEKEFESNILEHIEEINEFLGLPEISSIHRQRQIRVMGVQVKMDIVLRHIDQTATIIEVKKVNNKNSHTGTNNQMQAIGQLLLYQNLFKAKTGGKPRLVLIDNKIYERTMLAFLGNNLPITLVDFQKDRIFIPYRAW